MIRAIQRPLRNCCISIGNCVGYSLKKIEDLIRKVASAVIAFFKNPCCKKSPQVNPIRVGGAVNPVPNPFINIGNIRQPPPPINPFNWNFMPPQIQPNPIAVAPDQPVEGGLNSGQVLEKVREFLNSFNIYEAERLIERNVEAIPDAAIFNTLWDEFPNKKQYILRLANAWASSRTVKRDPNHMYAPIFDELKARKDQLQGRWDPDDIVLAADERIDLEYRRYTYTCRFLLSFQELSREENLKFIEQVMNTLDANDENKTQSYGFAKKLSKLGYLYHLPADNHEWEFADQNQKIRNGVAVLMILFNKVRELSAGQPDLMDRFFKEGLAPARCFDARVSTMEAFGGLLNWHEDFKFVVPVNLYGQRIEEARAFAYFNPFKHRQILSYVAQKAGDAEVIIDNNIMAKYQRHIVDYTALRDKLVERGNRMNNPHDADVTALYDNYITPAAFKRFLEKERVGEDVLPEYVWNIDVDLPNQEVRDNVRWGLIQRGVLADYFSAP